MILENKKGVKREFNLLFKVIKDEKEYLVYQDKTSSRFYASCKDGSKLTKIDEDMLNYLDKLLAKMM